MRQSVLLLLTAAVAIASPVLIPIAAVLHARDQRRMQVAPSEALYASAAAQPWAPRRCIVQTRNGRNMLTLCITIERDFDFVRFAAFG
jgi:hypothetical protein